MKTKSVCTLAALPMFLLAGCGVAPTEVADLGKAESAISSFTFDSTQIAVPPSGDIPSDRLTLSAFEDSQIQGSLVQTMEAFTPGYTVGLLMQQEATEWSYTKDASLGQVMILRNTPSGPPAVVDEGLLQNLALSRLETWGLPRSEVGTVLQRQSIREDMDGAGPSKRSIHRYKTFVFRAINGIPVEGHRAVVTHTLDGTFNRALIKWPALASSGHQLHTSLSTADIQARAESALISEGETDGDVTLRWKYVATPLPTGEVTLALKVGAIKDSSAHGEEGGERREITVDVDAL